MLQNPTIRQLRVDANGNQAPPVDAIITMGPNGWTAVLPAVSVSGGGGGGGTIGWDWASAGKNWDKNKSYGAKEAVYVQKSNAVVSVGVVDVDTGLVTKAFPGTWICLQPVAPVPDGVGGYKYRVPQWPLPTPDDADAVLNYWWPLDPACL